MTNAVHERNYRRAIWGWRVLALLGILLIADGAWLFFAIGGGSVFQSDTGVPMSEVREAFPTVVEVANRRGDLLGISVLGLGVVTLVAGIGGRTRDAWNAAAAVGATLLAVATYLVGAGNFEVGVVWMAFAALGVVGLALARRGRGQT